PKGRKREWRALGSPCRDRLSKSRNPAGGGDGRGRRGAGPGKFWPSKPRDPPEGRLGVGNHGNRAPCPAADRKPVGGRKAAGRRRRRLGDAASLPGPR